MRCGACDCELTDFEATRKSIVSGDYLDLCGNCLGYIVDVVNTSENYKLYDPERDLLDFRPSVPPSNTDTERDTRDENED